MKRVKNSHNFVMGLNSARSNFRATEGSKIATWAKNSPIWSHCSEANPNKTSLEDCQPNKQSVQIQSLFTSSLWRQNSNKKLSGKFQTQLLFRHCNFFKIILFRCHDWQFDWIQRRWICSTKSK